MLCARVVNGPTSSGPNPARTRKLISSSNHAQKNPKVKLGLKNLAILPSYFDYFFVHLWQKVRLRPELSPKFLSTLGPNPTRKARPHLQLCLVPASWLSSNAFVSGAGDLRLKFWVGQIGHCQRLATAAIFLLKELCFSRAQWRGVGWRELITRFGVLQQV